MSIYKKLKDSISKSVFYPVTKAKVVLTESGSNVEDNLGNIIDDISNIRGELSNLQSSVKEAYNKTVSNRNSIVNISNDIVNINNHLSNNEDNINTLSKSIETLTQEIANLKNSLSSIPLDIKTVKCKDGSYVKGDGYHLDTTGIQSALDNNEVVNISNGSYLVEGVNLRVNNNVKMSKYSKIFNNTSEKNNILINIQDAHNSSITGGYLQDFNNSSEACIKISNSKGVEISDMKILRTTTVGILIS